MEPESEPDELKNEAEAVAVAGEEVERMSVADVLRREVELVHPWPEWIELMERLAQQRYFDLGEPDEGCVASAVPMDLSEVAEEAGFDFSRDWTTVKNACMNFGRDRFDILKYVCCLLGAFRGSFMVCLVNYKILISYSSRADCFERTL